MNTKEYLEQVEKWDKIIKNRIDEISRLEMLAQNISSKPLDKVSVVSSGPKDKIGGAVSKIIDIQNTIDGYMTKREAIIEQLETLSIDEYQILYLKYIRGCSFSMILDKLNESGKYSERKMYRKYKDGLNNFEIKYGSVYADL